MMIDIEKTPSNSGYLRILRSFFGQDNTFTIPKVLVKALGSHTKALYLSQLVFWSSKKESGCFYKKYDDWHEELLLKERTVRNYNREFEDIGFLKTKIKKVNNTLQCCYILDFYKLLIYIEIQKVRNVENFTTNENHEIKNDE